MSVAAQPLQLVDAFRGRAFRIDTAERLVPAVRFEPEPDRGETRTVLGNAVLRKLVNFGERDPGRPANSGNASRRALMRVASKLLYTMIDP